MRKLEWSRNPEDGCYYEASGRFCISRLNSRSFGIVDQSGTIQGTEMVGTLRYLKQWAQWRVEREAQEAGPFYLFGEDMGLVGPFPTRLEVERHYQFQKDRGDAAIDNGSTRILTESEAQALDCWEFRCTPDEDMFEEPTFGEEEPKHYRTGTVLGVEELLCGPKSYTGEGQEVANETYLAYRNTKKPGDKVVIEYAAGAGRLVYEITRMDETGVYAKKLEDTESCQ